MHAKCSIVYQPTRTLTDLQFLGRVTASRKQKLLNGVPISGVAVLFVQRATTHTQGVDKCAVLLERRDRCF